MASHQSAIPLSSNEKAVLLNRYDDLKFTDDVSGLSCSKCNRLAIHHFAATCGHQFCNECKKAFGPRLKCPTCQKQTSLYNEPNKDVEQRIRSLKASCPNHKYGCEKIQPLKQITLHLRKCQHTNKACQPVEDNDMDAVNKPLDELADEIKPMRANNGQCLSERNKAEDVVRTVDKLNAKLNKLEEGMKGLRSQLNAVSQSAKELESTQQSVKLVTEQHDQKIATLNMRVNDLEQKQKIYLINAQKKCMNILLVGETGNGKSTLINAFANYSHYRSFSEAMDGDTVCVIPAKFTVTDDDYNESVMTAGADDANECMEIGESGTMACKSYVFDINECLQVRWIDSPGMASTNGPQDDDNSLNDIASYAGHFDDLHAIAVVVNGTQSKNTLETIYSLQQIFLNVHRTAISNLIFIFTHASRQGKSLSVIKTLLQNLTPRFPSTPPHIKLTKNNVFCFENKGFLDLMACKSGIQPASSTVGTIDREWATATDEFQRLLNYVAKLKPHDVTSALSVNRVRQLHENTCIIHQEIQKDIEDMKTHQQANIEQTLKQVESEERLFSDAAVKMSQFIRSSAILATNDKKQEYIDGYVRKRCSSLLDHVIESRYELWPVEPNALPVSLVHIGQIKKRLLLSKTYGPKFNVLCQDDSIIKTKSSRDETIATTNKTFRTSL